MSGGNMGIVYLLLFLRGFVSFAVANHPGGGAGVLPFPIPPPFTPTEDFAVRQINRFLSTLLSAKTHTQRETKIIAVTVFARGLQ